MSFPNINAPLRTNESFRSRRDEEHHSIKDKSPLENIEHIDMISDFVVADELHLLHLGIMKKFLVGWKCGGFNFKTKWSSRDTNNVSQLLVQMNKHMPREIHRRIRPLETVKYWKGLEFRTVLLYVGIVVLKDVLPEDVYEHFLKLVCGVTICSSKSYLPYIEMASECFNEFIEEYIRIYGIDSISSNVHLLCHVL